MVARIPECHGQVVVLRQEEEARPSLGREPGGLFGRPGRGAPRVPKAAARAKPSRASVGVATA